MLSQENPLAWYGKKLNRTQQKHSFTNQKKRTTGTTKNKHKKLKPGLAAFYDICPQNGGGLFSKETISKEADKEKVKKKG